MNETDTMNKPWPTIVARYAECEEPSPVIRAMLRLSERIANSPLATGLYAWTSMFDLCITQTEVTHPYFGPYLKVSPLLDGRIEFRYLDTNVTDKQWHRIVESDEAFSRMLKFLDQLHWFPSEYLQKFESDRFIHLTKKC